MNPETIFAIIAYAIGMVYICRGVSMKQEKQDYLNGYELSKLHGFIKANGDMHEHGSVPKHLSYWAEKGYIAGMDEREFKRDLILYF